MKHLKSSLGDLRQIFDRSVTARYLAEPFVSFDGPRFAPDVREFMEARDFDVVGVRRGGALVGYASRGDLHGGTLDDHFIGFDEQQLVDEAAPIVEVLQRVRASPRVFVQMMGQISGIITKGDLQKAPVRMWLFGLLSLLEMQLLRLIRTSYPNDSWVGLISADRVQKARELLADRRRRNEAIDLADCLQFGDKRTITLKAERLRAALGFKSPSNGGRLLQQLEDLRNELAHAQDIITGRWPELVDLATMAEQLVQRCEAHEGEAAG